MPSAQRDYLSLLLDRYWFAPPVALWRAIELRVLAEQDFPRPILDLGCGDGLIAEALFAGEPPIEAGFDPWWDQLRRAVLGGMYVGVQQAVGRAMPYRSGSFASLFSNSVLEHIPDLQPVLEEAGRVLRPGGRFLATVPSDAFHEMLGGYRRAMARGDRAAAEAYAEAVDRRLEHYRYPTPQEWAEMLAGARLKLVAAHYYIPAPVAAMWDDANHRYGIGEGSLPFYRWLASPRLRRSPHRQLMRRWVVRTLSRRWRPLYKMPVPCGEKGAGLLIVAERVA